MTNVSATAATSNPSPFAGLAPTVEQVRSRLDSLLAVAQNVGASPVARGAALAEADAIAGGRVEQTLARDGGAEARLVAGTAPSAPSGRLSTRIGGEIWSQRTQGLQQQLAAEAQLQRGANPGYSRDLAAFAARLTPSNPLIPDGTYRVATPPAFVRAGTRVANPLEIDTISPAASQARIQDLNGRIATNNGRIAELRQSNTELNRQLGETINPIMRDYLVGRITVNAAQIQRLEATNVLHAVDRNKAINDARLQPSRTENGNMYQAIAEGADPNRTPVIFVNGVNTDVNRSALQAMEISAQLRTPVNHVVNVSSMDKLARAGAGILAETVWGVSISPNVADQRIQQHLTGNREAAATTANAILDQLQNTSGKVKLIGYSQGGAIGADALRMVNDILAHRGVGSAERTRMLARVEFLGIGPAAAERHISRSYGEVGASPSPVREVRELRAVDYRTIADANDPIARLLNVSNPDGSRTNGTSLGRTREALAQLTRPEGILPHLSYFRSYEATDPGSIYNPAMSRALHQWYAGTGERNVILRGANTGG